ncbi:NAD(P)-dependent oxidoreductase [Neosynechococcus sphagnicola]|uniref:NAD(P)-dependent oxidoreductase n=1 Tax=Neosynechococcus sphagnicola TaxID=1501145 RepID=UPI000A6CA3A6|nr:NAD(P)-dependent oxidoreductase [Neosynechococcus sphagnicola]
MKIAALVCGRLEQDDFPGRSILPILGRPMMTYPLLAALHAQQVEATYLTTDSPLMSSIARNYGVPTIQRPPQLATASTPLDTIIHHAYQQIRAEYLGGEDLEALVVLLCNAPTVTASLIDEGIEMLVSDRTLDSVVSVTLHREHHPNYALRIGDRQLLEPMLTTQAIEETHAYFNTYEFLALRPHCFSQPSPSYYSMGCVGRRVAPLVHEGYGDIDYPWQVPAVAEWLRRHHFTELLTPYDPSDDTVAGAPIAGETFAIQVTPPKDLERRVLITTVPFGEIDPKPLQLLEAAGIDYVINPIGRKLRETELADLIGKFGILIAGTEPITATVMDQAPHLRLISRVGIGLDSVDLKAARQRNVLVSYTPDAPAPAVAELTVGMMLSLLRHISQTDRGMRNGIWQRYMGRRLAEITVGVIGVGRVGKRVIQHLQGFGCPILANDLQPDFEFGQPYQLRWVDKETIYRQADLITLHVPLTPDTHHLIDTSELALIQPQAFLINTARGPVIREQALVKALQTGKLAGAAIDVFEQEPYSGALVALENCLLTCHMGSCSRDCRSQMEIEATEEAIRFLKGEPLLGLVPETEYSLHR